MIVHTTGFHQNRKYLTAQKTKAIFVVLFLVVAFLATTSIASADGKTAVLDTNSYNAVTAAANPFAGMAKELTSIAPLLFIMAAVISSVIIFIMLIMSKGTNSFVNIIAIVIGVGIIIFASACFTAVPFVGTVFVLPGDNIMNAQMVNPALRVFSFLVGGAFAITGGYFQFKVSYEGPAKDSAANTASNEKRESKFNLSGIREAKELLDSGAITEEEFKKIKIDFINH